MKPEAFACLGAAVVLSSAGCAQTASGGKPGADPGPKAGTAAVVTVQGKLAYAPSVLKSDGEWQPLFDGKSLAGWKVTDFGGHGAVSIKNGQIVLVAGAALTGITWTNAPPRPDYEIALEAMKVDGGDFFCGLTLPAGGSHCTFIVGGWGGGVVGISSIDGMDASENETTKFMAFDKGRWFRIRVRVTKARIEAWIDDEKMVDQAIEDRRISMRAGEIEENVPFGVATWQTSGALRDLKLRQFPASLSR